MLTAIPSLATNAKQTARKEREELPTFTAAVETHKAMVYSIAWHSLHDRLAAEEVAQDVFLQLHAHWNAIQSASHLRFWLRRTATHRSIDAGRKRKAHAEVTLDEADEPTMFERVHDTLLSSYLNRMVATLPEKQRSVIILRYQEEMELEEIATMLNTNVSTVKTHISRGLAFLRGKVTRRLGKGNSPDDSL